MITQDRRAEFGAARDPEAKSEVVDWLPGTSAGIAWNVVGIGIAVAGLVLFSLPVVLRTGAVSGSFQFGVVDVLVVVALTALLMVAHEAIHGMAMLGFGARPSFGSMLVGHAVPALYATAEGHRFTRRQYLVIAAAPAVAISGLGFLACFGPWGPYLIVPLAIHLGGCVGDGFAILRALGEPSTTMCEDLRDGIRFHRISARQRDDAGSA